MGYRGGATLLQRERPRGLCLQEDAENIGKIETGIRKMIIQLTVLIWGVFVVL